MPKKYLDNLDSSPRTRTLSVRFVFSSYTRSNLDSHSHARTSYCYP